MKIILFTLLMVASYWANAKRIAPPEVTPIVKNKIQYSTLVEGALCEGSKEEICGMSGFLIATKLASKEILWKTHLYLKMYKPGLETDIQDVHPHSLSFNKKAHVHLMDERGIEYIVNAKTGELIKPLKTVIYMP